MTTQPTTQLNNTILATLRQRRSAGESFSQLANEVGVSWQRLWALLYPTSQATPTGTANEARADAHAQPQQQRLTWRQLTKGKANLLKQFVTYLRVKDWPFVVVDDAKKAIFSGSTLKAFDVLVYNNGAPNLLVLVVTSRPTPAHVAEMKDWEHVFGEGFQAAFVFHAADTWQLITLNDLQTPNPLAHARPLDECLEGSKQ